MGINTDSPQELPWGMLTIHRLTFGWNRTKKRPLSSGWRGYYTTKVLELKRTGVSVAYQQSTLYPFKLKRNLSFHHFKMHILGIIFY